MIETFITVLSFVYLFMIVEIIFSSTKDVMTQQKAFEGRILFFIYSLIVYYKNLTLNIFLWDTFLNEPIKQAYSLMNTLLESFFGISIVGSPVLIFTYLIPAGFIYHFVKYWFSYGFGDEKIANMISLTAVVMFIANAGNLGLINFPIFSGTSGVPFGGFLSSSTIFYLLDVFPSKFIGLDNFLDLGFGSEVVMSSFLFIGILCAILLGFVLTKFIIQEFFLSGKEKNADKTAKRRERGGKTTKFVVGFMEIFIFGFALLFYILDKTGLYPLSSNPILRGFALPVFFIAGLTFIAVVADFLVFIAFYMIIKDMDTATGGKLGIKK